jgi:hypothetical protein
LLHVGSQNITATGLRHTGQTVVMSGSNGTLEARWDGSTPPVSKIVGIRRGQSVAEELAVLTATSPGPTGADRSASLRSRQSDPVVRRRHPRGPPLRPDFGDGHAVRCVVEAALRTERTSMGLAPGAELSVLRRRS